MLCFVSFRFLSFRFVLFCCARFVLARPSRAVPMGTPKAAGRIFQLANAAGTGNAEGETGAWLGKERKVSEGGGVGQGCALPGEAGRAP